MRPGTLESLQKWLRARSQQSARRHLRHFPGSALCWFFFLFFFFSLFFKKQHDHKADCGPVLLTLFVLKLQHFSNLEEVIWRKLLLNMRVMGCQGQMPVPGTLLWCSGLTATAEQSCPAREQLILLPRKKISYPCKELYQYSVLSFVSKILLTHRPLSYRGKLLGLRRCNCTEVSKVMLSKSARSCEDDHL